MFSYLWNAFVSGLLFFVYLISYSWWWIFAVIIFLLMSFLDTMEVNNLYEDDQRDVL